MQVAGNSHPLNAMLLSHIQSLGASTMCGWLDAAETSSYPHIHTMLSPANSAVLLTCFLFGNYLEKLCCQDFIATVEATLFFKEITYKAVKLNHELQLWCFPTTRGRLPVVFQIGRGDYHNIHQTDDMKRCGWTSLSF